MEIRYTTPPKHVTLAQEAARQTLGLVHKHNDIIVKLHLAGYQTSVDEHGCILVDGKMHSGITTETIENLDKERKNAERPEAISG